MSFLTQQLQLQDRLNCTIDPDWRSRGWPFMRAAMVEAVEMLDHHGWKWWKAQAEPDWPQVRLELIDIWHFALSEYLQAGVDPAPLIALGESQQTLFDGLGFPQLCEAFIAPAAEGEFFEACFVALMRAAGLTWDDLHRTYVAKNVLNLFRQANGYRDGTYRKEWAGVVLAHLMDSGVTGPDALMDELARIYHEVVS